jgi:hypothetical protein
MTLKLQERAPSPQTALAKKAQVAPAKKAAKLKAANDAKKAPPPWLQRQAPTPPINEAPLVSKPVRVAHRPQGPPRWLPDPLVAKRYQVSPRTLRRWDEDPELSFPPVIIVNTRRYRELAALEEWERRTAANARSAKGKRLKQFADQSTAAEAAKSGNPQV